MPEYPEQVLPQDGVAAWGTLKKLVSKKRSNNSRIRPTVIDGNASSSRIVVISDIQQKIGTRMKLRPGARMLMIVTRKLSAAASEAIPNTRSPRIQKSIPDPGEYRRVVRFAYPNQPAS